MSDNPGEVLLALETGERRARVADWNRVIGELVESGGVEKTGERRGTRYRIR